MPWVVEFDPARVVSSVSVPLADLSLGQLLGAQLGAPVSVGGGLVVRGRIANAIAVVIGAGALGAALLAIHGSEEP